MTVRNLSFLLNPRSVALIGASADASSIGGVIAANLLSAGFAGPVMLVNPRHKVIRGLQVYPDVESLLEAPDLAIVATPPATVPGLIAALGGRGTKAAVVITAGFDEVAEGKALTQAMLDAARPHLLRIVGPNCLGVMVPGIGLNGSFAHLHPRAGKIALLAQSGAMLAAVLDWADARGFGFSQLVSLGGMADVDFGDLLDYLAGDAGTSAILLYVEAVTHSRKFMSAARIAARSKPVIVMKAGRHGETARAVASHTGALAGSDEVYDAAFRRAGMLRVFSLEELFEAVTTLSTNRRPRGDALTIVTNGGGLGILATDALIDEGGSLATLSPATVEKLNAVLPRTWSHGNPVDIIGDAPGSRYGAALSVLLADPELDAILVLNCPTAITSSAEAARAVADAVPQSGRCVLTSWVGETLAQEARQLLTQHGIPTFETPEAAVRAFAHLARYRRGQELLMQTPPSMPDAFAVDLPAARAIVERALAEQRTMLTGPESRDVLAAFGIPVIEMRVAESPAAAAAAAAALGKRVALKILSPDITHKSDVGGVVLGLDGPEAVRAAAEAMLARVRAKRPEARIAGFTVEPMMRSIAHELIVGMVDDAQFGPVLLFGQGGTAVEVIGDRAVALPPLNGKLARELMERTRVWKLLQGYRDRPPAAIDAIVLTLLKVSQLVIDLAEVVELDINPLLADADGVIALDARIGVRPASRPGAARLAIKPYPRELEETVEVDGFAALLLRPIRPEDEPPLIEAFRKLSAETVRRRFFAPLKELSHATAARLTQIDYDREMALVVADPGPAGQAALYAVVRISADPDNERAEFAIVVRDDVAGRGLGRLLMRRIIDYARRRGIGTIVGDILAENAPMLDLARRLGFRLAGADGHSDVVRATLVLRDAPEALPDPA